MNAFGKIFMRQGILLEYFLGDRVQGVDRFAAHPRHFPSQVPLHPGKTYHHLVLLQGSSLDCLMRGFWLPLDALCRYKTEGFLILLVLLLENAGCHHYLNGHLEQRGYDVPLNC